MTKHDGAHSKKVAELKELLATEITANDHLIRMVEDLERKLVQATQEIDRLKRQMDARNRPPRSAP